MSNEKSPPQTVRDLLGRPATWVPDEHSTLLEKLYFELCKIALGDGDPQRLPALQLAISAASGSSASEPKDRKSRAADKSSPPPITEEELDAEIAELQAQLGSLPNRHV